ncbi:hypothetical protein ACGFWF_35975 [Streptomyces sp. NPDC048581]|uniref:hypothetical protein n=1 Tax=Streptomyces sp. NPDC048581 TaxID=3365572 RepID=UPI00371A47FC
MTDSNSDSNSTARQTDPAASQPPYATAPAPYQVVTAEQRAIWETKGKRALGFGAAWLIGGVLITTITYSQAQGGGVYVVAWGPALYGIYRIVTGLLLLNKSQSGGTQ